MTEFEIVRQHARPVFIGVAVLGAAASALASATYADSDGYPQGVAVTLNSETTLHDPSSEATPVFDSMQNETRSNAANNESGGSDYQNSAGQMARSNTGREFW